MFDIGWPEIVVILMVALLVIGPRDLPKAFHTVGKWVRAARRVTADFQRHVDDMMREAELDDLRKTANEARNFNVKKQIENVIDPGGDLKGAFDVGASESAKPSKPAVTPAVPAEPAAEAAAEVKAKSPAAEAPAPKPRKTAKSSPRTASRVPKRKTATTAKPAAGKAPVSEPNS